MVAAHIRLVLIGTRTGVFDFSVHTRSVRAGTVSFQGNEAKVNYKGKASGDTIKFTVEVPGADKPIEYTAKRVS